MRNVDGLQPQEAFTELLKYLYLRQDSEKRQIDLKHYSPIALSAYLKEAIDNDTEWVSKIWQQKTFTLSDKCLEQVHELLSEVRLSEIRFDIKSQAIQEFLAPQVRKGLGIFLTPDPVVEAIVRYVNPVPGSKICDPACGSGTFLLECAKLGADYKLTGVDKNPRMLLLAYLNLVASDQENFHCELEDSLFSTHSSLKDNSYDYVFANPPFGVHLDARTSDFSAYKTCLTADGYPLKTQSSEIVFLEKCIRLLKPGGTMGIVIPKGIATNSSLEYARSVLSNEAYVYSIVSLPPETFSSTGTQTTTIVLFVRKRRKEEKNEEVININLITVTNVGYDATGRPRAGSELPTVAALNPEKPVSKKLKINTVTSTLGTTFNMLSGIFVTKPSRKGSIRLKDLTEHINIGRTPARSSYSESGQFLVKVGNLSGTGISWEARDRNFVNLQDMEKRTKARKPLLVNKGDILLTSSAHSPVYIAKKSDIVNQIPAWLGEEVSFVAEVMLIRPKPDVDGYRLLAYLKLPQVVASMQRMVRGQTAHLHSTDLAELPIDERLYQSKELETIAGQLRKQYELSFQMSEISNTIRQIAEGLEES